MSQSTLDQALATIQAAWRPLDSDLIGACLRALEQLAGATVSEPWLAELHERRPASTELARHPEHGFVLLAHAEPPGLYRPPHDHGRAWVVYAVQSGAMEVRTFIRVMDASGLPRLIQRDSTVLGPGEARAYRSHVTVMDNGKPVTDAVIAVNSPLAWLKYWTNGICDGQT